MTETCQRNISYLLVLQVALFTVKNVLCCNSEMLSRYNGIINILIFVIISILIFYHIFKEKLFKLKRSSFLIVCGVFVFWFLSFLIHQKMFVYSAIVDDVVGFVAYSFYAILFIPSIKDKQIILGYLYKLVYIMAIASIIGWVLFYINGGHDVNGLSYSMSYGKNAVFPAVILMSKYKKEHKIIDFVLVIVLIMSILLISSRFPLLYIMAYVLLSIFFDLSKVKKVISVIGASFVVLFFANNGIKIILDLLSKIPGIASSRTLVRLLNGQILLDSGRDEIHSTIIEAVNDSPIWGYGAGGSVLCLNGEISHGFIYDCWGSLGYMLGTIFILFCFVTIILAWYKNHKNYFGELLLVFGSCFFPTVLIQDSLFDSYKFWWLLALTIGGLRRNMK